MRYIHRGVLLGTVLSLFIFCKQFSKDQESATSVYIYEQEKKTLPDGVSVICRPVSQVDSAYYAHAVTGFDVVCTYIRDNNFCKWRYDMTAHEVKQLMKVGYDRIVSEILKLDHLSSSHICMEVMSQKDIADRLIVGKSF